MVADIINKLLIGVIGETQKIETGLCWNLV